MRCNYKFRNFNVAYNSLDDLLYRVSKYLEAPNKHPVTYLDVLDVLIRYIPRNRYRRNRDECSTGVLEGSMRQMSKMWCYYPTTIQM